MIVNSDKQFRWWSMARPSIKDARSKQILDAFEVCVARHGVAGATLAKTAEVAGLARPLVRHNVGNRDDLLDALVERFLEKSEQSTRVWVDALPTENRLVAAVELLFDPRYSDAQLVQVSNALIAASAGDARLARKMRKWIKDFVAALDALIAAEYPDIDSVRTRTVATGIVGIYNNVEALYPLGGVGDIASASRDAALLLLESLEHET